MDPPFTVLHIIEKMNHISQSKFTVSLRILVTKFCVKKVMHNPPWR